jgi:hypothetical protein
MRRLRKLLFLTFAEQRILIMAALLLGAIRLGLWLLPFRTLQRLLDRLARKHPWLRKSDQLTSDRIVWAVATMSRYVPKATCLAQALAAQVLLFQYGYPSSVRVGVARGEEKFEAHAWVENQGSIVIGAADLKRYTLLLALEGEEH